MASFNRATAGVLVGGLMTFGLPVIATTAATLAAGVALAPAASAADNIAFRASAQSAANQITHRVTIPASVRETDSLLLFVSSHSPRRWAV